MKDIDVLEYLCASKKVDLHGLTRGEAEYELTRELGLVDVSVRALEVVHGYHNGKTLKNLVRNEFEHKLIEKKVPLDASRTLYVLNFSKIMPKKWVKNTK